MREVKILLNSIEKVKNFSQKAMNVNCDLSVRNDKYIVDGKSIMGIFSLDLSKQLTLVIFEDSANADNVVETFRDFII